MSANENIRVRVLISGNVQDVGFRFFTKRHAIELELTGWVQNLSGTNEPDDKIRLVEAVFQGIPENVKEIQNRCKKGNSGSGETEVKVLHKYPVKDNENSFELNMDVIKGD